MFIHPWCFHCQLSIWTPPAYLFTYSCPSLDRQMGMDMLPMSHVIGWMTYVIYLSTHAPSKINIILESCESLHFTYLLSFIHGWMDWWVDGLMAWWIDVFHISHFICDILKYKTIWHIKPLYIHIHWFHVCAWRVDLSSIMFQPIAAICGLKEKQIVNSLFRKNRLLQTFSHALALRLSLSKID